jgi:hypothetical protein
MNLNPMGQSRFAYAVVDNRQLGKFRGQSVRQTSGNAVTNGPPTAIEFANLAVQNGVILRAWTHDGNRGAKRVATIAT